MVPRREALLGSTFETRNNSSRGMPAMASAMTSSASPYISAVSIWVMPRSMPRRSAAIAPLRSPRSRYQVPCPITETSGPLLPNFFCFTITSIAEDADDTTTMQRKRILGREAAQPIAEARRSRDNPRCLRAQSANRRARIPSFTRSQRYPGWWPRPRAISTSTLPSINSGKPAGCSTRKPISACAARNSRQFQTAQVEAAVHAQLQQHRADRLQLRGRIGDAAKAAGYLRADRPVRPRSGRAACAAVRTGARPGAPRALSPAAPRRQASRAAHARRA